MTFSTASIARALGIRSDATVPQLVNANTTKLAEYERRDAALAHQQALLADQIRKIRPDGPQKLMRQRLTNKHKMLQAQRDAMGNIISALQSYQHALDMLQITKDGVEAMRASTTVLTQVTIPNIEEVEILTEQSNDMMDKIKEVNDQVSTSFNMDCSMFVDATDDGELEEYLAETGFAPVSVAVQPEYAHSVSVQSPEERFAPLTIADLESKLPRPSSNMLTVQAPAEEAKAAPVAKSSKSMMMRVKS